MTTRKLVSVRVDGDVWRRVRMKCLASGEPATSVIERLLVGWLSSSGQSFTGVSSPTVAPVLVVPRETFSVKPYRELTVEPEE